MADDNVSAELKCSFCGKDQEKVRKLIAGPKAICDECVDLCNDIIAEGFARGAVLVGVRELRSHLSAYLRRIARGESCMTELCSHLPGARGRPVNGSTETGF